MEVDNVEKGLFGRAKMAKLEKTHLTMPSVELKFGLQIDNPKQRVLELNEDLLAKIEAGEDIFVSLDRQKLALSLKWCFWSFFQIRGEDEE